MVEKLRWILFVILHSFILSQAKWTFIQCLNHLHAADLCLGNGENTFVLGWNLTKSLGTYICCQNLKMETLRQLSKPELSPPYNFWSFHSRGQTIIFFFSVVFSLYVLMCSSTKEKEEMQVHDLFSFPYSSKIYNFVGFCVFIVSWDWGSVNSYLWPLTEAWPQTLGSGSCV